MPLVRPQVVDGYAADQHRAGRLRLEARDDADERRLAAAGCADERQELAVRDVKADVARARERPPNDLPIDWSVTLAMLRYRCCDAGTSRRTACG